MIEKSVMILILIGMLAINFGVLFGILWLFPGFREIFVQIT